MNKITIKIFLAFLLVGNLSLVNGQCLPNGITFTSQSQIDDFPINYPDCTEIIGYVFISGNLNNLNGLSQVTNIGGFLKINNTTLENLNGLENLQTIQSLLLEYNDNLQNIQALGNIDSLSRIRVDHNPSLSSLVGLEGITNIPLELDIHENLALESLNGLQNVVNIGNYCDIYLNPQLENLNGLESLTEVGWSMTIGENASLNTLEGLDNLSVIGRDFTLNINPQLTTLSNLQNLTSVGGYLMIQNQDSLITLDGLENLININGFLNIGVNNALSNIEGIKNIDASTITQLQIFQNNVLSECAVQSVCNFLNIDPNNATIDTNASGCNTKQEVEAACALGTDEKQLSEIKIYPNPSKGIFEISNLKEGNIDVIDSLGRIVKQFNVEETTYSISELTAGIYFLKITSENSSVTQQLIKT